MGKKELGILCLDVFRNPKDYNYLFFQFKNSYFGFKYIIGQIDKNKYSVSYIKNISEINNFDFVLCSFVSFEDYYLFLKIFKNIKILKPKIIIGGSGILNIIPLLSNIDIACFGRCDNQINDILQNKPFENVWYKEADPFINNKYTIGQLETFINISPDLRLPKFEEVSVGCKKKCFFCNYTFKYNYKSYLTSNDFSSGYNSRETTFKDLKWDDNSRYLVCAIDAVSEQKRFVVNKNISNIDIKNKILERNNFTNAKSIQIKLYNIYGFPFEEVSKNFYNELDMIFKECDSLLKYKITFLLHNTHFVPMPLTPMENENVNIADFKNIEYSFSGKNIKCIKTYTSSSYNAAKRHTLINRLKIEDLERFLKNKKDKYFEKYYEKMDNVLPCIKRPVNIEKYKKIYYERKEKLCSEWRSTDVQTV